jgi:hypothetical protein
MKQTAAGGIALVLIVGIGLFVFKGNGSSLNDGADEPGQAVELMSHEGEVEDSRPVRVTGVVRNTSERRHSRVKVQVRFFDEAGSQVGDTTAQTIGLRPGKEWRFEVPVVGDSVARYEIDRVTWQ